MATDILIYNGTAVTSSFNTSCVTGSAIQSPSIDFATPRAASWVARLALQMASVPTAGEVIDVYMAYASANASTAFPASVGISAGAWTGYVAASQDISKLEWIGSLVLSAAATSVVQIQDIGVFTPKQEFGVAVLFNRSTTAPIGSATVAQMTFTPIKDQSQ